MDARQPLRKIKNIFRNNKLIYLNVEHRSRNTCGKSEYFEEIT